METALQQDKYSNQLLMALDTPVEEREQTLDLQTGYDAKENTWELIVRYQGDLAAAANALQASYTLLTGQFAIVTIEQEKIEAFSQFPEVLYLEKPVSLQLQAQTARQASCITQLQSERLPAGERLTGAGVLAAVLDSGIDYAHPDFRREDGTSRILALWDQTAPYDGNPYGQGSIYTNTRLNASLAEGTVLSSDANGHGTAVAGIAAGNGRGSRGMYAGVAPESELLIVRLAPGSRQGFAKTTSLMKGMDFVVKSADALNRPVAVNVSYGTNYGAHNGESILEFFFDSLLLLYRGCLVVGAGNEGASGHHASVLFPAGTYTGAQAQERKQIREFVVAPRTPTMNVQIWKNDYDDMNILLRAPSGAAALLAEARETRTYRLDGTRVLVYYSGTNPYSTQQEIYLEFVPETGTEITAGNWSVELLPTDIKQGNVDLYLPATEAIGLENAFLTPDPESTLTIPGTAKTCITVSAYNAASGTFAAFSGEGYIRNGSSKPDLCAPGVEVMAPSPGGGYARRTGTSFSTPFVTGACALLMEWGIVKGNDPYLYGEKAKAYLIRGAKALGTVRGAQPLGTGNAPSRQTGWGALCVADSLPL